MNSAVDEKEHKNTKYCNMECCDKNVDLENDNTKSKCMDLYINEKTESIDTYISDDECHASKGIFNNHPTFFASQNELSKVRNIKSSVSNKNKHTATTMKTSSAAPTSSDRQNEVNNNFHSILSYLCHASPSFSLRHSGLDKALRERSLSFPSVFVDEEMQRGFNDMLMFGEPPDNDLRLIDDDNELDIDGKEEHDPCQPEITNPCNADTDMTNEWKTIPIEREDASNSAPDEFGLICPSFQMITATSEFPGYFNDHHFQTKMKELLYLHHRDLIDSEGTINRIDNLRECENESSDGCRS